MDVDDFEERAAIMEYCGGFSRFEAETLAAKLQGKTRYEVMNEIRERDITSGKDNGETGNGNAADNLS